MSQQNAPVKNCHQMRRYFQKDASHCFWSNFLPVNSEIRSRSMCCSLMAPEEQEIDRYSPSNGRSHEKAPLIDNALWDIDESLINNTNMKEESNKSQKAGNDSNSESRNMSFIQTSLGSIVTAEVGMTDIQKVGAEKLTYPRFEGVEQISGDHSLLSSLSPTPSAPILFVPEFINSNVEMVESLFGPQTTIVKTVVANATQIDDEDNFSYVGHVKTDKGLEEETDDVDETESYQFPNENTYLFSVFDSQTPSSPTNTKLKSSDLNAFQVLNTIYRDATTDASSFTQPTATSCSYRMQNAKTQACFKYKRSSSLSVAAEQWKCESDSEHEQQRQFMDEYFHRSDDSLQYKISTGNHEELWSNQKCFEYYEFLCQGIKRALANSGSIDLDCGAGSIHTPSSQQTNGICRAMKSDLYYQYSPGPEIYSRKVFVGGLPIDIDEDELTSTFSRFGPLIVDWPNKNENKSYFPPKGYVFLIFEFEASVRALVQSCFVEDEKLFLYISSPLSPDKLVQIRPWRLADADYVVEANIPLYTRRAIFVGGVPRPIKAVELAHIMDQLYGSVGCAGIDTDVEYKYPKGAGRIAFTNQNSYMKAITDRYVQLSHGEVEKRVELKPYVLDDQPCDECGGERCGHRNAPFFCPQLSCLQYYCEKCWTTIHSCRMREDHKPLVKEA